MEINKQSIAYKATISVVFGLLGFAINFFMIDFSFPPYTATVLIGLLFPMLITLAWGWKYGLLAALVGGCQSMWWLWGPSNGYATFLVVPPFTLWIVWHGLISNARRRRKDGKWWLSPYIAEIPFRILSTINLFTLARLAIRFNPPPWNWGSNASSVIPFQFSSFVVVKQAVVGCLILLLADVVLSFRWARKFFGLEEDGNQKITNRIIGVALLLGFLFWVIDSVMSSSVFHPESSFLDALALNVSPYALYVRTFFVLACLAGGLLAAKLLRKQRTSDAAMQESKGVYRVLADNAVDVIWQTDLKLVFTYVSPSVEQLTGYTVEEWVGTRLSQHASRKEFFNMARKALHSVKHYKDVKHLTFEAAIVRKDGTEIPVEITGKVLFNKNGLPIGLQGATRDITERKQAEKSLQEAHNIISLSPTVAFLWKNEEGWPVEYVSDNVTNLYGYTVEEFTSGEIAYAELIHPADLERVMREVAAHSEDEESETFSHAPYRIVTKSGATKWVDDRTAIRRDSQGRITHYQGILIDITARVQAEEREREHHESIEFLANAAMRFVNFPADDDIYRFIGDQIRELGGESIVIVNSIDEAGEVLTTRAVLGVGQLSTRVMQLMGRNPEGMTYDARDEDLQYLSDGRLHSYDQGLYGILLKTVPKPICAALEKLYAIGKIHTMGFTRGGRLFGTLAIILSKGRTLKAPDVVETFVQQASIALQRKRAEQALIESEKRFRLAGSVAYDLTYEWVVATDSLEWFGDIDGMLAYSKGEISSDINAWLLLIHPDDIGQLQDAVEYHRTSTTPIEYGYRVKHKDGTYRYWEDRGFPLLDGEGKPYKWIGVCTDITERRQAEEALSESEAKLRNIVENSTNLFYSHTPDHQLTFLSPQTQQFFDCSPEEAMGIWMKLATDNPINAKGLEITEEAIRTGKRQPPYELELIGKKGRKIWVEVHEVPVAHDGEIVGMVGSLTDITERKRAEAERLAMEAHLRQSQKLESIGTLASGVAHEINNPLMGMINYADLIGERVEDDTVKEYSQVIMKEGNRIATIVRNLLSFSRQEKETHSPAEIRDIIDNSLSLVGSLLRKDQITLDLDIPDDLPQVKCRSQQIQQVIMNLLTNAHDALNERYPEYDEDKIIRITARAFEKDGEDWIRTTIEDHGVGVPEDIAQRIFDPFFTTKSRAEGTGLGLSISFGIVREHHGELTVESVPGEYTRFHMDLRVNNGWNHGNL